jgi:hypothetical protein
MKKGPNREVEASIILRKSYFAKARDGIAALRFWNLSDQSTAEVARKVDVIVADVIPTTIAKAKFRI